MELSKEIEERIAKLAEKYQASGQDLVAYLDGLLYADYITYWDYIHLDTLLSLQNPRTSIPDEEIFIMYHQITELYFKLSLHEMEQLRGMESVTAEVLKEKVLRINRYFGALTHSFGVMTQGMRREEFLKFRMSLMPASGFQSVQYRLIEVAATDFINLVDKDVRDEMKEDTHSIKDMYQHIYWKKGATIEGSGDKTLTLKQFEKKYTEEIIRFAKKFKEANLWQIFKGLTAEEQQDTELRNAFRMLDINVNVNWPLQHYKTSVTYLAKRPHDIAATGGTNWQKYLPPRFQKRIFYPELWSATEIEEWGRGWVESVLEEVRFGENVN